MYKTHDYYEINEIKNGIFKYVLSIGPIDFFHYSLTLHQAIDNLVENMECLNLSHGLKEIADAYIYADDFVTKIEEKPHTIRFLSIPRESYSDLELVVIAKISNNGTCFIFSNNRDYLEWINTGRQ